MVGIMRTLFAVLVVTFLSGSANAALLGVDPVSGELFGAFDVEVDGTFYDVLFFDGTCVGLFDGCDEANFVFQTSEDAELASTALLEQVFVDDALGNFGSDPSLTSGCGSSVDCNVLTPYARSGVDVSIWSAVNVPAPATDFAFVEFLFPATTQTASSDQVVWAFWMNTGQPGPGPNPVPEPGTAVLLGMGLLGIASRRKHFH